MGAPAMRGRGAGAGQVRRVSRGAFGIPTFFVGGDMFWGNDRLEWVEAALQRA